MDLSVYAAREALCLSRISAALQGWSAQDQQQWHKEMVQWAQQTALSDVREAADCSVGNCFCLPETNHTGARCEFAPAYTLSGCAVPEHCGVFARTNRTCDDAPAYQSDVGVSASPALVSSLAIESVL